jgi:hypothetical protein
MVGLGGHRTGFSLFSVVAMQVRAPPECPNRQALGKRFRSLFAANPLIRKAFHAVSRIMTAARTGRA